MAGLHSGRVQRTAQAGRCGHGQGRRPPGGRLRESLASLVMVLALSGLACCGGRAALGAMDEPLRTAPADDAVRHALAALASGDAAALAGLGDDAFCRPPGIGDPADAELVRPWTDALSRLLQGATPALRARALVDLERREEALAARIGPLAAAPAILPSPRAVARLQAATDAAFDQGRFGEALALDALLARRLGQWSNPRRDQVAWSLLAGDAAAGPLLDPDPLVAPGAPEPWAPAAAPELRLEPATGYPLRVQGRYALASSPTGVLWQRRIPDQAQVVCGSACLACSDGRDLTLIAADGQVHVVPLPDGADPWACGRDEILLRAGRRILRCDPSGQLLGSLTLSEPVLTAPLLRGRCWLGASARELVLVAGDQVVARMRHGLPVQPGWTLRRVGRRLQLAGPGQAWWIPDAAAQLAAADPAERILLSERAGDSAVVLGSLRADPALVSDDRVRAAALRACFASATVGSIADAARGIARSAQDQAEIEAWCGGILPPDPALLALLHQHAEIILPLPITALATPPEEWPARLSAAAVLSTQAVRPWPVSCDPAAPLAEPRPHPAPKALGLSMTIAQGLDWTAVTCRAADGSVRWSERWSAPVVVTGAPDRTSALVDGWFLVGEGASRLQVIEPWLGRHTAIDFSAIDAEPVQTVVLGELPDGSLAVASLHPLAINDHLTIASSSGLERTIALGRPAHWMVRAPGAQLIIAFGDGTAQGCDRDGRLRPLVLPAALVQGPVPAATADGLFAGGLCYPWRP